MRHVFLLALFLFAAASATSARAESNPASSPAQKIPDRVQLVEDDENGALRIVIDGKEIGRIDAAGLHVQGDVNFSGLLTDTGGTEARAGGAAAGEVE